MAAIISFRLFVLMDRCENQMEHIPAKWCCALDRCLESYLHNHGCSSKSDFWPEKSDPIDLSSSELLMDMAARSPIPGFARMTLQMCVDRKPSTDREDFLEQK